MIQGEILTLPLPDLLQWLALTRRTGKLAIVQGDQSTALYFASGEVAGASSNALANAENADQICAVLGAALALRAGRFSFTDGPLPVWVLWTNLRLPTETLLLNAVAWPDQNRQLNVEASLDEPTQPDEYSATFTLADELRLQVVDQMLNENIRVPAMPQLAARVLELTRNEDYSLRDLGNLVLTDQAVAARVLRYANSALRGVGREVDSLVLAVQRLGASEVVNIVLTASLQARRLGHDRFAADKRRLWLHSSAAAFFARTLAARVGLNHHLGFLCGLLMDFGMTVLYTLIQDLLARRTNPRQVPAQVIEEIVRDYHPRIGRVVGENWRLPQAVIEAMAYHHCLEDSGTENPYVGIAALADFLATFALSTPREALDNRLANTHPEWLASHTAARFIHLSLNAAAAILQDIPRNLDQALEFVLD